MTRSLLFVFLAALVFPACHHAMDPAAAVASLSDPNPVVRQHAADSLRAGGTVDTNSIPPLVQALQTEQVPHVRGAILITLGQSGAPGVQPIIEQAVQSAPDVDQRRWAGRALKAWMLQSGKLPQGYVFPEGWPYGQPGYPPPIAK
jgi:HEAT repeats